MNKVYAVADIHGQYDLWTAIKEHLDENDTLYILGDCGDRGPDGWKIIKEALADKRVKYIRGNHDQFLIDSCDADWILESMWYYNGGYDTHQAASADPWGEKWVELLKKTSHLEVYENRNGQTIYLSHAGFTLVPGEIPSDHQLLWDRGHFLARWVAGENDYVVHGHTFCASHSGFAFVDTKLNDTYTVGRYCNGHKICIDGRAFLNHRIALLDLDTLQETVLYGEEESEFAD